MFCLPHSDAQVHRLDVTFVQALTVLKIIQNGHHVIVHLVDLSGYVVANAASVQKERNVIASADHEGHFDRSRCFTPELGVTVGCVLKNLVAGFARL